MRFKYTFHTTAGEIDVEAQELETIVSKGSVGGGLPIRGMAGR